MKASNAMRAWFAFYGAIIWLGIYLSGFANVHWLLYVPATGIAFAAITGICPSQIAIFKLFGSRRPTQAP
jgi:hypothetical protein